MEGAEGVEAAAVGEEQDRMSTVAVMRYRIFFMEHIYYHYKINAFSATKVAGSPKFVISRKMSPVSRKMSPQWA